MKIEDILTEQIDTEIKDVNTSLKLKVPHIDRTPLKRELGRGISNIVLKNKRDPHTVIRHNSNLDNPDIDSSSGYYNWLVTTKAFNENPYFPRIYQKTTVSDKSGKRLIKYEIEKLASIESLDITTIRGITERLFDQKFVVRILKSLAGMSSWADTEDDERALLILLNCLEDVFFGNPSNDESLNAAMAKVKELSKQNYVSGSDLHRGNVMVRLTPHGPQLVLTDPI